MGRFYRTSSSNPIDYMYKANIPLMERVIAANDKGIDENMAVADKLDQLANYNHLVNDDEDAKAITDGYKKQISDVTNSINSDPANWKKQLPAIRSIKDKLQEDYSTGAISKQIYNYNKRASDFATIDKQVELYHKSGGKKGLNPTDAVAGKQYYDKQFTKTGYNSTTGEYNPYLGGTLMDNIDVRDRLNSMVKNVKADQNTSVKDELTANGAYFNMQTHTWEGIRPEKLLSIIANGSAGDSELHDYLRERTRIGTINGVYNRNPETGEVDYSSSIQPFDYKNRELTPEDNSRFAMLQDKVNKAKNPQVKQLWQSQLDALKQEATAKEVQWNNDSYLSPIMQSIVGEHSYSKTTDKNDLSNNSLFNTQLTVGAANARAAADRKSRETIAGNVDQRAKDRLKLAQDKFDWEKLHPKGTKTTGTGASTTKKTVDVKDLPAESEIDHVGTNSFESMTTHDPKTNTDVPLFSVAGVSADVDKYKKDLEAQNKALAEINSELVYPPNPADPVGVNNYKVLQAKKEKLELDITATNSNLNDRRAWYKMSTDHALSSLTPQQREEYNAYPGDKGVQMIKKELDETRAKHPDIIKDEGGVHRMRRVESSPEVAVIENKLKRYVAIKNTVDKGREDALGTLRKDFITEDGIKLGANDAKDVANILLNNSVGAELFNNRGQKTDDEKYDDKGLSFPSGADDHKFTFADGSLNKYITNNGVEIVPLSVSPTTGIGKGNAVVKVQFKDPLHQIPEGEDFYISVSPDQQRKISQRLQGNTNPVIASKAKEIDDELGNTVRRQITKPDLDFDHPFTINIKTTSGANQPLTVTKIDGHYNIVYDAVDETGKKITVPLPSLGKEKGFFSNPAEIIASLKAIYEGKLK